MFNNFKSSDSDKGNIIITRSLWNWF